MSAPSEPRPPRFPPPQFPPPKVALFATTPPAIFPPILGLIGLGLALRQASAVLGFGAGLAELALGLVVGLWGLAVVALLVKVWRRAAVLAEDLRPLPGRAGLAAASMSAMAMGAVLAPYAPGLALALILVALGAHLVLAGLVLGVMRGQGAEGRVPNPTWHLSFTGIIVAAAPLASLGWTGLAWGVTALALACAVAIWALSARQLWQEVPPAPLRPLLAIHLAPAALMSLSFGALGEAWTQRLFLALAVVLALALVAAGRWMLAAGFSALWGALTFPIAALALATLAIEPGAGMGVTALALGVIPTIAWSVLKLWPGGKLAARSHAAQA
ncbi:tellurium resistance protein [Rhodobacter sp. KR11]|uniref:SLAC1 family transporter n=1 Tax=Rhodobacter sp. KR11 TaxID=2974588 RepID=UPI002223C730|nr:tellurium resistance protein [Rhodobacter sp. KR11]MCW1919574.1 tellurium resistance protein [Rhodobacter sp. KR11]